MPHAKITALNIYPVKSCRGIALDRAQLTATGLANDRNWLIINEANRFQTQRELPRLSLIKTHLEGSGLRLSAHGMPDLAVPAGAQGERIPVTIWNDQCSGIDAGANCAEWLSRFLNKSVRLVSFDATAERLCDPQWVGDARAQSKFADAFPLLVLSEASLENLNHRLTSPVPMNRFRPNIVLSGLKAHDEDRIVELYSQAVRLRMVKACTRCAITTTDQATGRVGEEPLRTLKSYRWDPKLRGVTFGQNAIILRGAEATLRVGQELEIAWA
jgi:uncharacterized protein YcbX